MCSFVDTEVERKLKKQKKEKHLPWRWLAPCKDERKQDVTTPRKFLYLSELSLTNHLPVCLLCFHGHSQKLPGPPQCLETIKAHHTLINWYCPVNEHPSRYEWFWHVWIAISAGGDQCHTYTHTQEKVCLPALASPHMSCPPCLAFSFTRQWRNTKATENCVQDWKQGKNDWRYKSLKDVNIMFRFPV